MANSESPPCSKTATIIVIGAGLFGLTTALELRRRGYTTVTVLDRMLPPVPDGSSVDVSRVIRYDYADLFYARLARDAVEGWQSPEWCQHYHNSGIVLASQQPDEPYIAECKRMLSRRNESFTSFEGDAALSRAFPSLSNGLKAVSGYINPVGGWADAQGAVTDLARRCSALGVSFICGSRGTVTSLIWKGSNVVGVNTSAGPLYCDQVMLSSGAWTNRLVNLTSNMSSSGQPVAFVQLTKDEAASLADMPVVINFTTGVFIFPPTPNTHLLKIARHSHGFSVEEQLAGGDTISAPQTNKNHVARSFIPDEADEALRAGLRYILPQFADRPWKRRRLCWYADTPVGDFLVDHYPGANGLFIAAGGAGHAFKFLPVLGKNVVDCFEGKASDLVRSRWKVEAPIPVQSSIDCNDGTRRGPPRRKLSSTEMARL